MFIILGSLFCIQRPNVGEYHIHKLRHKPLKTGNAGGVGGASSLEDIPAAAFSHPSHSFPPLLPLDSSDNDSLHKQTHERGAEPLGGKQSTDSDPLSDDSTPPSLSKKSVAINTEQVEHFTHRLLPVQSPEFDNVMDQARVDRFEFSCEVIHDDPAMSSMNGGGSQGGVASGSGSRGDSLKRGIRFSHFARMESSQVLEAATQDLVNIFQLKVLV